jgi:nucleoside-diphosphate kinase
MEERTLAIVKPDAVAAGAIGGILGMIESTGLKFIALRMKYMGKVQAARFYAVHKDKPFFDGLVEFMASGPIVVAVLEGENAIEKWRELMGPTDSSKAPLETVRGRYGIDVSRNAVHGSDSAESAAQEIPFFFRAGELP